MSFIGNIIQGQGQAMAAQYNAQIAQQNAVIAQQQGAAAVDAQTRMAERTTGAAIAAYGASGVQSDSGSAVDVLADSAGMAALDRLTLKYNYALKAQGFTNQSSLDTAQAQYASTASVLNAASSYSKDKDTFNTMFS